MFAARQVIRNQLRGEVLELLQPYHQQLHPVFQHQPGVGQSVSGTRAARGTGGEDVAVGRGDLQAIGFRQEGVEAALQVFGADHAVGVGFR